MGWRYEHAQSNWPWLEIDPTFSEATVLMSLLKSKKKKTFAVADPSCHCRVNSATFSWAVHFSPAEINWVVCLNPLPGPMISDTKPLHLREWIYRVWSKWRQKVMILPEQRGEWMQLHQRRVPVQKVSALIPSVGRCVWFPTGRVSRAVKSSSCHESNVKRWTSRRFKQCSTIKVDYGEGFICRHVLGAWLHKSGLSCSLQESNLSSERFILLQKLDSENDAATASDQYNKFSWQATAKWNEWFASFGSSTFKNVWALTGNSETKSLFFVRIATQRINQLLTQD